MNRLRWLPMLILVGCGTPTPTTDGGSTPTCAGAGGTCGSVSTCGKGTGYLTASSDCVNGSVGAVCCLPLSACANATEFDCCASTATFRPSCVGGQLVCAEGQARCGADAGP